MFHHHRAYRELPPQDWRALHDAYAAAERLGVAEEPVKDYLNRDIHDTSPRIAYARAVLMAMASPQELFQLFSDADYAVFSIYREQIESTESFREKTFAQAYWDYIASPYEKCAATKEAFTHPTNT